MTKIVKRKTYRHRRRVDPRLQYEDFTERLHEATLKGIERVKQMSKEELAEKLTTYEPGVPHFWFGRPVEPITKEELLAHWNGGPEPEIHYMDVPSPQPSPKS